MAITQASGKTTPPGRPAPPSATAPRQGQLGQLMRSFDRSLRALNRSKLTRGQYLMSVGQMVDYFAAYGMPDDPEKITREHVEMFLADFTEGHKPATVQTRYKCLRLFFSFLLEEREIAVHPMANMKPPSIPEAPVPVFSQEELAWASSGLTDIQHQGQRPGKDVHYGDHGTEEAPSPSVVHPGVQG